MYNKPNNQALPTWLNNPSEPYVPAFVLPPPNSELAKYIKPIKIGNLLLPNNLILAPMAGVTNSPFRLLCSRLGAGYTVSELASSKAICLKNPQTLSMIKACAQTRPYAVQIFGSNPQTMLEAAKIVEEMQICDVIDINMGCPVSKVVKTGAGSALMKTPKLAAQIVKLLSQNISLPITTKCRLGWDEKSINAKDFVKCLLDNGSKAITVHARTRSDLYSGTADWTKLEGMGELCGEVPFFANGDIVKKDDLFELKNISNCSGYMIGRGCIGRPWFFAQLLADERYNSGTIKYKIFYNHLAESIVEFGPKGVQLFRIQLFEYFKNHRDAAKMRRKLATEKNPATILQEAQKLFITGERKESL